MRSPVIIDCDPGHDDAVALLLAFASPELDVLGVTVTHGNVAHEHTLRNALTVREIAGVTVPVYAGATRPLVREPVYAAHVHGESGLGDVHVPSPTCTPEACRAAEFIIDTVLARPNEVTLVPTGPLTNIALALRLEPRVAECVKEIVLMGGSADHGNTTPAAEFNFYADPHAARVVLESGARIVMFGLNATRQVPVTDARVQELRAVGTRCAALAADLLQDYLSRLEARDRAAHGALHDPCTVAYLVRPDLFETQAMHVTVDTTEGPNDGRSTCDVANVTRRPPNAHVAMRANASGLYALLCERLGRLP